MVPPVLFYLIFEAESILELQTETYAKEVEEKRQQYIHYNILPLNVAGVKPAIMNFPEVVYLLHM